MELPYPTGQDIKTEETQLKSDIEEFWNSYSNLFAVFRDKNNKTHLRLRNNLDATQLHQLKKLLQEKTIKIPSETLIPKIKRTIGSKFKINLNSDQINALYDGIVNVINKHNHFFDNISSHKQKRALNNYITHAIYQVSSAVVNQSQAQAPVDQTTEGPKKISQNNQPSYALRTPGAFTNRPESIEENQVGKDCIAICAVGLKGFFALTDYANIVLNSGDPEAQRYLIGKINPLGIGKANNIKELSKAIYNGAEGNTQVLLANIRAKDISSVTNPEVLALLQSAKTDEDSALILSALLSLSTDNAKELVLSKLNAGRSMIGMYIYAISIGMDFKEVSKLLMSDTGRMITETMQGNSLQRIDGIARAEKAYEYFIKGPYRRLNQFKYTINPDSGRRGPLSEFLSLLTEFENYDNIMSRVLDNVTKNQHVLVTLLQNSNADERQNLLNYIKSLRERHPDSYQQEDVIQWNRLIDFVEEYTIQFFKINGYTLDKLSWLSKGAEEMRIFGQIAGLNQGLKTSVDDIFNLLETIEGLLYDEETGERVTIQELVYADEEQKQNYIRKYEKKKHTFNLVHALYTVPHLLTYVKLAAIQDSSLSTLSYKYRNIRKHIQFLKSKYGLFSNDEVIKGFSRYLDDQTTINWLKDSNIEFTVPEGSQVFNPFGELLDPITHPITLKLGDIIHNASFRVWMEETVIPDLQKKLSGNIFIRDLTKRTSTKTTTKNSTDLYTLNINLMPRTDEELDTFKNYQEHFNVLSGETYSDAKGKVFNVRDLMTLYVLIAHEGRLGENSLMQILKDQEGNKVMDSYQNYITNLDLSQESVSDIQSLENELKFYLTSKRGVYGNSLYAYQYNEVTGKFNLVKNSGSGYTHNQIFINPEYLTVPAVLPTGHGSITLKGSNPETEKDSLTIRTLEKDITSKGNRFFVKGTFKGQRINQELQFTKEELESLLNRKVDQNGEITYDWNTSALRMILSKKLNPTQKC